MGGGFPIDLILFGMIAAFLIIRLRGILGRRTGFERQQTERPNGPVLVPGVGRAAPVIDAKAEPTASARPLPDAASPIGLTLVRMRSVDQGFDPATFLHGAETAFRMIVDAFARGDRVALRPLLDDPTYRAFETAIATRETAGETQRSEIRSIERATIDEAALDATTARLTVRFVSDQVAETLDKQGRSTAGSDAVTEITDIWTFERDLRQPVPAWRLTAAHSG